MASCNKVSIRNSASVHLDHINESAEFFSFNGLDDGKEHIALGLGKWRSAQIPTVRLHSECLTGDVFHSQKCDCGSQLNEAMHQIDRVGGFLLYLRQEGRGIGLYNKIDAYHLQNKGMDTFQANHYLGFADDLRSFKCAAEMLLALGHKKIKLISNNPIKKKQLETYGIEVVEMINTSVFCNPNNYQYLKSKVEKSQHQLAVPMIA